MEIEEEKTKFTPIYYFLCSRALKQEAKREADRKAQVNLTFNSAFYMSMNINVIMEHKHHL